MKAALLTEINKPLEIIEVDPTILKGGQVLVRVLMSGICGAQLQEIRGEKGTHFPRFMGHEGCGIVEYVGPGVTRVKQGQRVVMHWRKASGIESEPPRYTIGDEEFTAGQVTTFSEFSICSENRLTPVPDDVPPELCALLGCGLSTALGVMENEAKLKMGESMLIVGCGGVGLNLIRVAKLMGASFVVGCDSHQSKSHEAFGVGASQFYNSTADGEEEKFDVIVDTTGSFQAFQQCCPRLAPSGRYILIGQPQGDTSFTISNARHLFDGEGKTIKATQGGGFNPDKDIPRYVAMWRSGNMKLDGVVTHRFDFESINEAIEVVKSGNAGRVMLEMV